MMSAERTRHIHEFGFTLIETLAAMALMGLVISVLAVITSQWLPNWNRGFDRIQRGEAVSIALDRISADIAASEYIRPDRQTKNVLFDGSETSITLARVSLGPNAGRGLDLVRIAETGDREGMALTRSRAKFAPGAEAAPNFANPVVLLRAPYRVSFSYAGSDRVWKRSWRGSETLPAAVLLTVRDAVTGRVLPISRIAAIHISAPADGVCNQAETSCDAKPATAADGVMRNTSGGEAGK
jgi:general secretion pathway protein J